MHHFHIKSSNIFWGDGASKVRLWRGLDPFRVSSLKLTTPLL